MKLFRLDASVRTEGSTSREVADTVESAWRSHHPDGTVKRRDLGNEPLPEHAWRNIVAGGSDPADRATAVALSATLADELLDADAYLFAVPLYNYGVPLHVKAWIDLVIADPRTGPGQQPLAGRPAVLVATRGGGYGPGTPREGWDHSTPYLRRILADVAGLDLRVVEAELTLAAVTPELAALRELGAESLSRAHITGREHGGHLAGSLTRV